MTDYAADVQQRIDDHLDAIDRVLQREEMTRSERRHVIDDVENQIRDMLAERVEHEPSVPDVDAVLAELDPPEAYADMDTATRGDVATRSTEPPRLSRVALTGLIVPIVLLFPVIILMISVSLQVSHHNAAAGSGGSKAFLSWSFFTCPAAFALILMTICGFIAISQIRHSAGRLYGLPLALVEALLFPLIVLDGILFFTVERAWAMAMEAYETERWMRPASAAVWVLTVVGLIVLDIVIIRRSWKAATRPVDAGA